MREELDFIVTERTENHARLLLAPREGSSVREISGLIRGPYSDFSKTLTSDSRLSIHSTSGCVEALVVEPCYWTPQLPFWYDLFISLKLENSFAHEEVIPIGIKRSYCAGRNILLEGKRIVLRGIKIVTATQEKLELARKFETALVVNEPTPEVCQAASRLGVPLIVDLRGRELAANSALDWYSAVTLVLVNTDQAESLRLRNVHVAACIDAKSGEPSVECDAYAVELSPGERPPHWAATCDKPVIVICKDPEAEIRTARAGCDKLQAELAPEFDLAGYFV